MRSYCKQSWFIGLTSLIACAIFGLTMLPINRAIEHRMKQQDLLRPPVSIKGGDALSQQLAFFSLGGLRAIAAEILSLDATAAWSTRDWTRLELRYEQMSTLCPKREQFWTAAANDMSSNAAGDINSQHDLPADERARSMRYYIHRAEQFLRDGIANNPSSALIYARLGDHHANIHRYPEFSKAAEAYKAAVEHGASSVYERMQFYSLCRIRGREQEAWVLGRKLFADPAQRVPSLCCLLFALQNKLAPPANERMSVKEIFGSEQRALRLLKQYVHNDLRYPRTGVAAYLKAQDSPLRRSSF